MGIGLLVAPLGAGSTTTLPPGGGRAHLGQQVRRNQGAFALVQTRLMLLLFAGCRSARKPRPRGQVGPLAADTCNPHSPERHPLATGIFQGRMGAGGPCAAQEGSCGSNFPFAATTSWAASAILRACWWGRRVCSHGCWVQAWRWNAWNARYERGAWGMGEAACELHESWAMTGSGWSGPRKPMVSAGNGSRGHSEGP